MTMRKALRQRRFGIVAVLVLPLLFSCRSAVSQDRVCFSGDCYDVELALTPGTRQRGLQHRPQMALDQGMLFVFPVSSVYGFWMKDTLIPLDIIWLDQNRRIIHIEERVPPCESDPCPVYGPVQPALYVLEINAGQSAGKRLKAGLTADFQIAQEKLNSY